MKSTELEPHPKELKHGGCGQNSSCLTITGRVMTAVRKAAVQSPAGQGETCMSQRLEAERKGSAVLENCIEVTEEKESQSRRRLAVVISWPAGGVLSHFKGNV
jgi:hypothetical protein